MSIYVQQRNAMVLIEYYDSLIQSNTISKLLVVLIVPAPAVSESSWNLYKTFHTIWQIIYSIIIVITRNNLANYSANQHSTIRSDTTMFELTSGESLSRCLHEPFVLQVPVLSPAQIRHSLWSTGMPVV